MTIGAGGRARRNRALSYFQYAIRCCLFACLSAPCVSAATSCAADHIDEQTHVAYVHDGDTVRLQDGRSLRLIGIDTPELGRDGGPDQPYAIAARDALRGLLAQRTELDLRLDETRLDVHGRLLAHAFLADGTSVSAWLLERGYATLLIVPPDDWNVACYQAAERHARAARLGIWALPGYQPVSSMLLDHAARGYHLVKGRVAHVGESARSLWLDLEGKVAARIDRKDLRYFTAIPLRDLSDKDVIVRGWVYLNHDEMQLRLRYPTDIEIVDH
jgi:micrococcal nuclease